jgi:diguanylate cyclase (GGDEF)-like protein
LDNLRHQSANSPHRTSYLFRAASPRIIVADPERSRADDLANQVALFGYTTVPCTTLADVLAAVHAEPPAALVCDLSFIDAERAVAAATSTRALATLELPIIFTAAHDTFTGRLEAVRAGGLAYFARPIDMSALVAHLDEATARLHPEPYRVLIVEDSHWIAQIYADILTDAGIAAVVAHRPTQALDLIAEQVPDLILLDMYMPECDGRELAAVIRQQPELHRVPIVFLSAETDRNAQLAALARGGDDFLTKPIPPDHLIAAVRSRIQRARMMRSQMVRDGLTGLLNHSVTKEHLAREVARARRSGNPLAMAMIDIDHFKQVNDTYGHAAGDQVLKSLARLLVQRLRASDIVGRYGGEEFAVIMPETEGSAALTVLDEIRTRFAQLHHRAGAIEFHTTFSGGIATLTDYGDAATLHERADSALYRAKRSGRNRIALISATEPPHSRPAPLLRPISALPGLQQTDAAASNPPHVLVVYANNEARRTLQNWLANAGNRVDAVSDGTAALAYLAHTTPDVVFLDAQLAGVSGLDVLARLHAQGSDSAIVMLTSAATESIVLTALRHGADDFLRTPIDPLELQVVFERTLARLRLSRQNTALRQQVRARHSRADDTLEQARRIQAERLPSPDIRLPGYSLAGRCRPAPGIGADWYDWYGPTPGCLQLTAGDVIGLGLPAALRMATAHTALRAASDPRSPRTTVQRAAQALAAELAREHTFVRLFHAALDLHTGRLRYVDAGHGLGLLRRASGQVITLDTGGMPLGLGGNSYAEGELWLEPGDALIVVSDGLAATWDRAADPAAIITALGQGAPDAATIVERALPADQPPAGEDDQTILVLLRTTADMEAHQG